MIIQFNFNNYLDNPIAKFCLDNNKRNFQSDVSVLTLDDVMDDILKLRHSSYALSQNKWSFIGDQLRLHYSLMYDDFLYLDSDVFIKDFKEILSYDNCTELTYSSHYGKIINNGTFFHSNKDCKFNKFYFDLYEHDSLTDEMVNYVVFKEYPFEMGDYVSGDMNLISPKIKHFLLSQFYFLKLREPELNVVRYTYDKNYDGLGEYWLLHDCPEYMTTKVLQEKTIHYFDLENDCVCEEDMFSLFKEQLCYTFDRTIQFLEL